MPPSLAGQFLVAGKHLRDPNFHKTVVLMIEHGENGAMGLVVNRPTSVGIAKALAEHFTVADDTALVHYGGPVEPAALFVVHDGADFETDDEPVVPGVYVGSSAEAFERVVSSLTAPGNDLRFRIYAGCAGWGPGQLEGELERGDWFLVPATSTETFDADPYTLWESSLDRVAVRTLGIPRPPGNADWN